MALKPGREDSELTVPADYGHDHPDERPEQWGWHADFGGLARLGGWISIIACLLMMTSTHYNLQGALFLGLTAIALFLGLMWDRRQRKNSWRQ